MSTSWIQVQGSTLRRPAGAGRIDEIDSDQQLTVTVRGRDLEGLDATVRALDETPAGERQYLNREGWPTATAPIPTISSASRPFVATRSADRHG
jgi:hypothetical protein